MLQRQALYLMLTTAVLSMAQAPAKSEKSAQPKNPSPAAAGTVAAKSHKTPAPQGNAVAAAGTEKVNAKDGLRYVWIPAGTFQMGCSPGDNDCDYQEKPAHTVRISKGFWMGQTLVTQAAYQRVRGSNPSHFHGDQLPVETVTWDDANGYCAAVGMRLPTEAEWEYARAGDTASRYGDVDAISWYGDNSGNQRIDSKALYEQDKSNYWNKLVANGNATHAVGQKQPNGWKLYDMLGNVWEWTSDWYDKDYYSQSPSQDPRGPSSGTYRVLRGGSWGNSARVVRVSNRDRGGPGDRDNDGGFRCAGEVPSAGGDDSVVIAAAKSQRTPAQQGNGIAAGTEKVNAKDGLKYVWIPAGTFQMGCSPGDNECFDDEKPAHTVTISKGFWMGQTLVTQAAYQRVRGNNPSHFHGDQLPVEKVTWDDANGYCAAVGMRLPTEAEWEYAARAGDTTSRYGDVDATSWYGDNSGNQRIDSTALYQQNDKSIYVYVDKLVANGNRTHEVRQKPPNAWKLYDILGNVWEWTSDWYDKDYYSQSPSQDPRGPSSGTLWVVRGGSWFYYARYVRVSNRGGYPPAHRFNSVGFRCAGEVP